MSRKLSKRKNLVHERGEHWKPPSYRNGRGFLTHLRARVLRFLDLQAGTIWSDLIEEAARATGTVVDVGCGLQPYRPLFSDRCRYIGIDREDVKTHFSLQAPDVLYYSGDRWPLESGSADFVLCTETLEHVLDPRAFIGEMFRCLKPGGRVFLTVPFAARWHFVPLDYWRFTPSCLEYLFTQGGFAQVAVYGRGNQLTVACYKGMGFVFSLLSPRPSHLLFEWLCRGVGAVCLPGALVLAVVANATISWQGAVDFLGFTVVAQKPEAPAAPAATPQSGPLR